MFTAEQLLGQLLKSGLGGGLGRGKRKRKGSLLGGMSTGAKAQIGMGLLGVAIAAYEHYSQKGQTSPAPSPQPTPAPTPQNLPQAPPKDAILRIQAMVAAAAADGVIDDEERALMLRRATEAGFNEETKRFLESELANPKSLAVIVASSRPELATDIYAASCAAITPDTDAERTYLATLGRRLNLSEEAQAEVQRQLNLA